MEAFGFTGVASNLYKLNNNRLTALHWIYEAQLLKKFGGMVQGQYYFNNQWFFNAVYGVSKAYGVSRARFQRRPGTSGHQWYGVGLHG